jgi:alpha-D-xyloside xylohydrolase
MKFIDGNWLVPENLALLHQVYVHQVLVEGNEMVAHIAARELRTRADQINAPLFILRLFSPAEGIIGVRVEHFQGAAVRRPAFRFNGADHVGRIEQTDATIALHSGGLAAVLPRQGRYRLDFVRDGVRLTGNGPRDAGYALERDSKTPHVFQRLDLSVGENVYGLGERFTAFVKNGQTIDMWNRDGGTGTEQAYKNIPFFLTNAGWGVLVNNPGHVEFEVATERVSKVQFSIADERLEYFVIDGPTPKEVLQRYTALTGRPGLPPAWSFGLWLTTSFTTSYDQATVASFIDGMRERDIPLHVFHYDCFWMRGLHWCDFEWDPETFPNPAADIAHLKELGLHVCVWINPYIAQLSPLFAEGREKGYLLRRPDGGIKQTDDWQPGMALVDFTNPEASAWYAGQLKRLLDMGVDCFKTDFGERVPTDVVWHDGSDPERMHNYYTFLYNKTVFELLKRERGDDEAVVFARSATVGSQQFPVHWGGDCDSNYPSMAESLRGGLSLGLSGFGFWSHDISGFEGTATPDVYKRWCAFGLLSSHSRLHGSESYRVPWLFDEESVSVVRHFTKLKCRLMPYLYAKAVEATETGVPVMRAMVLEFPEDAGAVALDRQYLLGDALLVAPVFTVAGDVDFYLPPGTWTHFLTGATRSGGWQHERHDFHSLPLYVRENTLLAVGAREDRPDYDYADGVTLELYALGDGRTAACTIVAGAGDRAPVTVTVRRSGATLGVASSTDFAWKLLLVGILSVADATAPRVASERGVVIEGRRHFAVTLPD